MGYAINLSYFAPYLAARDRVLDFGCGNGGMLRLLSERVAHAEGLEVNPAARKLALEAGLTVHGSLDALPPGSLFDVVVSNHVLEHVRDASTTLEQVRELLPPTGKLLLKLPLDDWRASNQRRWAPNDIDHHLHTWTPRSLGNTLQEAGFAVDSCRVITSAWHPKLFPLARLGLQKPAFWAFAALMKRRQLFAVAHRP